jgi:hypothetical protein
MEVIGTISTARAYHSMENNQGMVILWEVDQHRILLTASGVGLSWGDKGMASVIIWEEGMNHIRSVASGGGPSMADKDIPLVLQELNVIHFLPIDKGVGPFTGIRKDVALVMHGMNIRCTQ